MDNRPRAHYRGDATCSIGTTLGPNLFGELLTIAEVEYDPETDTSTAIFRHTTADDANRARAQHLRVKGTFGLMPVVPL